MKNTILILIGMVFIVFPVYGQEQTDSNNEWQVYLIPYFGMPSLDADATVNGLSGSVDF